MASLRLRKVFRDLRAHRARTVLVVASVAVGVFAVGTIAGSQAMLDRALADGYVEAQSANAIFYTTTPFDPSLVDAVRQVPGVGEAVGRRTVSVQLQTGQTTRALQLVGIPDFRHQQIDIVQPAGGAFPPGRDQILFERSVLSLLDLKIGDQAVIELPGGKVRTLDIAGFAYEPGASPAYYLGRLSGYVTLQTLQDLGWDNRYQEIRIRATDPTAPAAQIRQIADAVRTRIEKAGPAVSLTLIPTPGKHPAQELLDAIFVVLGGMGFLSLFVSGFLVANTISVIMAQQTRQIGLMKAVGGGNAQIVVLYLLTVAAYSTLALAIALPAAAAGSYGLAVFVTGLVNLDVRHMFVPDLVILAEIGVGFLVPMLAAAIPIWRGMRVSVHDALRDVGVPESFGEDRLDRVVQAIRGLPRPTLLSIRNTFRRKGRLALTLSALSLAGAVFMSVFTVHDALVATLHDTFRYFNYDAEIDLSVPVRASTVTQEVLQVPGAVDAEAWQFATALRVRPNATDSASLTMFGLPPNTQTVRPVLVAGRWLLPNEGPALVVTANFLRDEPDVRIGDHVSLKIRGRTSTWTLVGVVQSPSMEPYLYVSSEELGRVTGDGGQATVVMVRGTQHDPASQAALASAVRNHLEAAGIRVTGTTTNGDIVGTISALFGTLLLIVSVMAILLGVVGGLGLAGTMTMNVVERAREIGVLRAIGAGDGAMVSLFMSEGLLVGVLAWAIGALVSIPISKILCDALGEVFVQRPLAFVPSLTGILLWLGAVLVLSVIGSLLPAWHAARIPVREVLAYE